MAWSAPSLTQASHLSSVPAVTITLAPSALAIWMAVTPIPLVPPWISKVSPACNRPRSNTLLHTVKKVSGSDDKCEACLKLGADHAINYKTHDFAEEAKKLTGGAGVNVILDMVAGSYVARELECLAEDGRLVIIAVQGGVKSEFNAGMVLRKRLVITGSTLRPRPVAFKAAIAQALKAKVWPLLENGAIKPVIHSTFAAADAAKAHQLMESNQHIGKIVLTWQEEQS
jgi:NADPH2:quinone reductase